MDPVTLKCPNCRAPIRDEDLHLDLGIARCGACSAIVDLAGRGGGEPAVAPRARRQVPLPQRITTRETGDGLVLEYVWRSPAYFVMLFFSLFWNAFVIFWMGGVLLSGAWFMAIFGSLHAAVGIGLFYGAIAGLLNRTTIEVRRGQLRIAHGPVPWRGNRELPSGQIEQLFSEEHVSRSKNGTSYSYSLNAILKPDRRKLKLMSHFTEPGQALYVEQQLERRLGIDDVPVEGEIPRSASV